MAKKETKEVEVNEPEVVVAPPKKVKTQKLDSWEAKDRTYILKGPHTPLTLTIPAKHTRKHALLFLIVKQISKENYDTLLI